MRTESLTRLHDVGVETPFLEPSLQHLAVDVVDGRDAGQNEVEHEEVTLEAVGDVVFAAARVTHGGDVLQVLAHLCLFIGNARGECSGRFVLNNETSERDSSAIRFRV